MGNVINRLTGVEKERSLRYGTYFSTIESVLLLDQAQQQAETPRAEHLTVIHRSQEHPFYSMAMAKAKEITAVNVDNTEIDLRSQRGRYDPDNESSFSSMRTYEDDSRTARSRKRRLEICSIDGRKKSRGAEIVHLVPHAPACASLYGDMVRAMAGMQGDTHDNDEHLKHTRSMALVHGVMERNPSTGRIERARSSGVKHNRVNMARVFGQKAFLDTWPMLLILPIKTLSDVLEYKREAYDVLIIGADEEVYTTCQITGDYDEASFDELNTAVTTLQSFVKAAAWSLINNPNGDELIAKLTERERRLLQESKLGVGKNGVKVPQLAIDKKRMKNIKIAKVTLSMEDSSKHQTCDPFALFIKAVSVVTSMQGQKLLPGCNPMHDCEVCLDLRLMECTCNYDDPDSPIPGEISFQESTTLPKSKRRKLNDATIVQ